VAQSAQLRAAERFAGVARRLFLQRPAIRGRVAGALGQNAVVDARRVEQTRRTIDRAGLPNDLEAILGSFGAPPEWTDAYSNNHARSVPGRRTLDARAMFTDDDLDDYERLIARYLDRLVRYIEP
jgi:hypothetical protein